MGALIFAHCGLICICRSVILIMQWRMLKMFEQAKKKGTHALSWISFHRNMPIGVWKDKEGGKEKALRRNKTVFFLVSNSDVKKYAEGI